MASREQKEQYKTVVAPYKELAGDLKKEMSTLSAVARRKDKLEPYMRVGIALNGLQMANVHIMMSQLSQEVQNIKNDSILNDARRQVVNLLTDLLKLVGDELDESLTDNKGGLLKLQRLTPPQRLNLIQSFKITVENVKDAMGRHSKWRWSFPETHYRLIILAKNIFDFKEFERTKDPSAEYYRDRHEFLNFMLEECHFTAQEYQSKFELSTKDVADLQRIRKIFEFMKRVYLLTGNASELEKITRSLESLGDRIESILEDANKRKG